MSDAHERKAKRILDRKWEMVRERWADYIPVFEPGTPPQHLLSENPELGTVLGKIPFSQVEEIGDDIPGLRGGMLHESIYLLHKGVHVLGCSLVHVSNGMCTWSLSSAYHSAFFAMKAISGMLGVAIVEWNGKHFMVDIWGSPQKPRKGVKWPIAVVASTPWNDQRNIWGYFQRTIEKTSGLDDSCPDWLRNVLVQSDFGDFGRQRNHLHYRNNVWYFDDLHQCVTRDDFATSTVDEIKLKQPDFSVHLACGLVRMGYRLLSDLAETSGTLRAEASFIERWLAEPFNSTYGELIPAAAAI